MMDDATLIFPATTSSALYEADLLRDHGVPVVLAASVSPDLLTAAIPECVVLPFVSDPLFPAALRRLVERHRITRIRAPVQAVHRFLAEMLADGDWPVRLVGPSPIRAATVAHDRLLRRAVLAREFVASVAAPRPGCSIEQLAALLRTADVIYGESSSAKIAALAGVFASVPSGDVVEIGALLGRSTAALALLSAWHHIGPVLAVDPWNSGNPARCDAPGYVARMSDSWAGADMQGMFEVNMVGVTGVPFGRLALPSIAARPAYGAGETVDGPLGLVTLTGRIALLHIDGNHDEEAVRDDCQAWVPLLQPAGWLVLDDYQWAHGLGPRRAGDEILSRNAGRIERAFVAAGALFVQFAEPPVG